MKTKSGKVLMTVFCIVQKFSVQIVLTTSLKRWSESCVYSWKL